MGEPSGIIGTILKSTPLAGLGVSPAVRDRDIVIELTEAQLKEAMLKGADPRLKDAVEVRLENGKMIIRIRLF